MPNESIYSLNRINADTKKVFYITLTDSAFDAINKYQNCPMDCGQKAKIQFLSNDGFLIIPSPNTNDTGKKFRFSAATITQNLGHIECIEEKENQLTVIGKVQKQLSIYQEQMCNLAEEIKKTNIKRKSSRPKGNRQNKSLVNGTSMDESVKSPKPTKRQSEVNIKKKSIAERLIHLLALRPHKKPEIFARITREGIKLADKNKLGQILCTISTLKNNTFVLNRNNWNEVDENWPYYTLDEKQLAKKNKLEQLNLSPTLDVTTAIINAPSPLKENQNHVKLGLKRKLGEYSSVLPKNKKLKIDSPKAQKLQKMTKIEVVNEENTIVPVNIETNKQLIPLENEIEYNQKQKLDKLEKQFLKSSLKIPEVREPSPTYISNPVNEMIRYSSASPSVVHVKSASPKKLNTLPTVCDVKIITENFSQLHEIQMINQITPEFVEDEKHQSRMKFHEMHGEYICLYADIQKAAHRLLELKEQMMEKKQNPADYRYIKIEISKEIKQWHWHLRKKRFQDLHKQLINLKRELKKVK